MAANLVRRLPPRNATQLVDQRAMDLGPKAVDRGLVARRDAVDGARLVDDRARHREVAFRGQELGDRRRPVGAQRRPAPPSSHRRPSWRRRRRRGDRTTVTQAIRSPFGTVRAIRPAGSLPMPISLPPSPTAEPDPGAGQEQIVERRGPRRDVDAAHVARPAVGAAAAALDGHGMADARVAPCRRHPLDARAVVDAHLVDGDAAAGLVRPPRAPRRRRAYRRRCAPARRTPPARPPARRCRRDHRSRAPPPRRAARRSR